MSLSIDEAIEKMRKIYNELKIHSILNSSSILPNVEKQIHECQVQILYLSRIATVLPFACSRKAQRFCTFRRNEILQAIGQPLDEIFFHFNTTDSQAISSHISYVFNHPEGFANKLKEYLQTKKHNIYAFSSVTFPSFFCNFSSFEFCCNAGSMLLEFMRICNNSSYIYQLVEPFLLSQYSYFDAFWYDFSKRVTDLITLTQIQVFKFLAETVQSTLGLIGLPFRSVILSISQLKPISTSTTFLFRVLIYKPSKLFLRHSPFFTNFRPKDTVINIIKRFSREPLTETIHIINSFNGARETPIDTIPNLIDDAHMVHLPLLVSDYDAIEYSKIVFSPNSLKKMFVDYTKDDNERKKTIFSPFQIEFFANRSYLAKSPDNNTIPKISVDFVLSLFKEDQIKALESEWQASSYHFPYSNYKSKESELYSLYKSCVEMNQKIDDLNQAIGLTCQLKLMKSYKSSLERHNFLIISYFLKKFETSQNNIIKGAKYVRDELRNLLTIKGNNSYLMIPYMIHVLNQFNCNLSIWIKPEITDRYYELIENKMSTKYVESLSFVMNANYVPLLSNLVFDADLRLGDRMTLLLEYLRMSKLFLENVNWEKTASNRFEFHSFLLVASQNGLLLETILMLENLVFQNLLFTKNFDCQIREMWCVLVQSLWHTIEDDAELMKMCGSIRVR